MKSFLSFLSLSVVFTAIPVSFAGEPTKLDAPALAREIDRLILEPLVAENIKPAPLCDDATFFRRVNLILAGRLAAPSEVEAFLADASPAKRARLIDEVLASKPFVDHLVAVAREWMLPEARTNPEVAASVPGFEAWLREKFEKNTPYDQLVKELLTTPLNNRQIAMLRGAASEDSRTPNNPLAYYIAKEVKPENLAASSARLFLGLQLECAQCHDHPFSKWTRDQFWGTAAFFGGIERTGGALREVMDRREMAIPNTNRVVQATFLSDKEPEWRYKQSSRIPFAEWAVARDNPFFAQASANRLWDHLFGVGIVDPIDNIDPKNPPSHPKLMELLARSFADSNFDIKYLLRAICLSETFQRSSVIADATHQDVRRFARFPIQGLSPEQLYGSLSTVIGPKTPSWFEVFFPTPRPLEEEGVRGSFIETFSLSGKKTESQTTILQALTLMNGKETFNASNLMSSKTLQKVKAMKGQPAEEVKLIYLTVLNRLPRQEESEIAVQYLEAGERKPERYADLLWAILNGLEFRTVH